MIQVHVHADEYEVVHGGEGKDEDKGEDEDDDKGEGEDESEDEDEDEGEDMVALQQWSHASSSSHLRMKVNSRTAFRAAPSPLLCRGTGTVSVYTDNPGITWY